MKMENDDYYPQSFETEQQVYDSAEKIGQHRVEAQLNKYGFQDLLDDDNGLYGWQILYFIDRHCSYWLKNKSIAIFLSELRLNEIEEDTYYAICLPETNGLSRHWIGMIKLNDYDYLIFDSYGQHILDIMVERGGVDKFPSGNTLRKNPHLLKTITHPVQNMNTNTCGMYQVIYVYIYFTSKSIIKTFQSRINKMFVPKNIKQAISSPHESSQQSSINDVTCLEVFNYYFSPIPNDESFDNIQELLNGK